MRTEPKSKGSIARAAMVLDAIATSPGETRLGEIARATAFTKTTAHRILASLIDINFVVQEPDGRGYRLGTALTELGRFARNHDIVELAAPKLERLAQISSDTIFLSIMEGSQAVCVDRKVGSFPIRTLTLDRGDRRPLGVGAGSLALYFVLPDETRRKVCDQNAQWLNQYGDFCFETLEDMRRQFLKTGYALNSGGIVPGMSAIAVPVLTRSGHAAAAITIAAISERMTPARIKNDLVPALMAEAELLAICVDTATANGVAP